METDIICQDNYWKVSWTTGSGADRYPSPILFFPIITRPDNVYPVQYRVLTKASFTVVVTGVAGNNVPGFVCKKDVHCGARRIYPLPIAQDDAFWSGASTGPDVRERCEQRWRSNAGDNSAAPAIQYLLLQVHRFADHCPKGLYMGKGLMSE